MRYKNNMMNIFNMSTRLRRFRAIGRRSPKDRNSVAGTAPMGLWLLVALALSILAGCGLMEERAAPTPEAEPSADTQPEPAAIPEANLSTAMDDLESGRVREAREILARLSREAPDSDVVARLMRQIDMPVAELLPGPYRRVEVRPGESLSLIAAREIGDPLMFYALARLNEIEVPARVPAGTVLRVPRSTQTGPAGSEIADAEAEVADRPSRIPVTEIESLAESLARAGQVDQARRMLTGQLADRNVPDSTQGLLVDLTLEQAEQSRAEGEFDRAISMIDEAMDVVVLAEPRSRLLQARSATQSRAFYRAALELHAQGELERAYGLAVKAAELDVSRGDATQLAESLRAELTDTLHNRALVAWRERNVDLAIRTWESLLAVVPDFEPARIYLGRARELRERLDEP